MINFQHLAVGDHFDFQGEQYKVIPVIKGGGCGCVAMYNCQSIHDEEIYGFFSPTHKVVKIEVYRTHPNNEASVNHRTRYVKRIIEYDESLQVQSPTQFVLPTIEGHDFVEYEETDTWLLFFGLAVIKKVPYYEKFVGNEWVPQV